MVDLSPYDLPFGQLEQTLVRWVEEALELRHGVAGDPAGPVLLPPATAGPQEVYESLLRVRRRLDRVEELTSACLRASGRARRASREAEHVAGDAWDRASRESRSARARLTQGDYTGPRERYADVNLDTYDQQVAQRAAQRLADVAEEAYRVVQAAARGLSDLRSDHLQRLRMISVESSMDR